MEELKEILNSSLRAIGTMALLLLAACSDIGDRDNPLDPGAENYAGLIMSSDSFLEMSSDSFPISSSAAPPSSASDCIGDDCFVDVPAARTEIFLKTPHLRVFEMSEIRRRQ